MEGQTHNSGILTYLHMYRGSEPPFYDFKQFTHAWRVWPTILGFNQFTHYMEGQSHYSMNKGIYTCMEGLTTVILLNHLHIYGRSDPPFYDLTH